MNMCVFKQLTGSAISQKVLKYLAVFGSVESISIVCSIIRTKLVAVFIGVTGVGLLGLFSNAVELLSTFTQMGLRMSAVKEISSADRDSRDSVIRVVKRLSYILAVIALVVSVICAPLMSYLSFGGSGYTWAFLLLSVVVVCNLITAGRMAILQAQTQLNKIAKASMLSAIISLVVTVPLIIFWGIEAVVPILMVYAVVNMGVFLCQKIGIDRNDGVEKCVDSRVLVRKILRLGFYLMLSTFITWLAGYLVLSYMNYAGGSELMGYYQSGYTLTIRYAGIVFTAMSMEYFPRLAAQGKDNAVRMGVMVRHQCVFTTIVVTVLSVLMMLTAPWVVRIFYSADFSAIVPLLVMSAPGLLFRGVSWCMAFLILAKDDGKVFLATEFASAVLCVALNVVGYNYWGVTGIGASFTLWYMLYALIILLVVTKRYHFKCGRVLMSRFVCALLLVSVVCFVAMRYIV